MILHLGVFDVPYARAGRKGSAGSQTTGDVAQWLENRYHVMEVFFRENEEEIASAMEGSVSAALESALMGGTALDPLGAATSKIEDRFKTFLSTGEMERLGYPGVPTEAARRGVNHRLKNPGRLRAARPSFIDTGLYQASFHAWGD